MINHEWLASLAAPGALEGLVGILKTGPCPLFFSHPSAPTRILTFSFIPSVRDIRPITDLAPANISCQTIRPPLKSLPPHTYRHDQKLGEGEGEDARVVSPRST